MSRLILAGLVAAFATTVAVAQDQAPNRREFKVVAENFRFTPDRIEVSENDLVKVALHGVDQPYTFAIDAYRIVKRVSAGQTISFEFRADQPGTFAFYCNMSADARCREMRGTLVVNAR
jgi:heme/copper-type cytochrome/quinol oxidase subunit 2